MPVSVCVCGYIAYLELNLVTQHEPISSVYMQLVCKMAGTCLLCVHCLWAEKHVFFDPWQPNDLCVRPCIRISGSIRLAWILENFFLSVLRFLRWSLHVSSSVSGCHMLIWLYHGQPVPPSWLKNVLSQSHSYLCYCSYSSPVPGKRTQRFLRLSLSSLSLPIETNRHHKRPSS